MGGPWHQGCQSRQIVIHRDADSGHPGLIELVGEVVVLVGGLTVIRVMEGLQQGRHGLTEGRIR